MLNYMNIFWHLIKLFKLELNFTDTPLEFMAPVLVYIKILEVVKAEGVTCVCLWWQCSVSCGEGIQQRQVVCKTSDNTVGECEGEKPETVLICKLSPCPGET